MNIISLIIELKDKVSPVTQKMTEGLDKFNKNVNKSKSQLSSFNNICKKIEFPNLNAIMQVFERLGDGFARATEVGFDFGQSIADLSSITGIAGEELAVLEERSRQIGKESGLGAGTAAKAYSLLASQIEISRIGIDGLNLLQEKSVTLAQAAGMSLDGAANALAGTINQFGLEAEAADRIINVLAAGSKYGAAEIEDLAMSFKVVGASASAMGLDVESTAGALEVLSQANLKGAEAGTALRNIILKLNTVMSIDLTKNSLSDALEALKPKLTDATFLSKVFGIENIAAAQFLIENASAVGEMTEKLTGTAVAEEQATVRTQTAAQSMAMLRAKVDDMKIGITNALGSFAPFTVILAENASAIALVGKAGIGAVSKILSLNTAIKAATGSTILQHAASVAMAAGAKIASAATKVWSGIQVAFNAVMSANPIALVVLAIAALVAGVIYAYNHCEKFREICDKVWSVIKNVATVVWDALVTAFEAVTGAIKKAWEWLKKFLGIKDKSDVESATDTIDEQTAAINNNTEAKKKNNGLQLDFTKIKIPGLDAELSATPQTIEELENAIRHYEDKLKSTAATETETIKKISEKIHAYEKAKEAIEQQALAATIPNELKTIEDIDIAIQYQQSLRSKAIADDIAGIDAEIKRLNSLKTALEDNAHTKIGVDQISTYEQLEEELSYYEDKLKRVSGSEREGVQLTINALKKLQSQWDEQLQSFGVNTDIATLNNVQDLEKAINIYEEKAKKASAEELIDINRVIFALEQKKESLESLSDIPSIEAGLSELSGLTGKSLQMKLELIGLDGIKSTITKLQALLLNTTNPLTDGQKEKVEEMIASYKLYATTLQNTQTKGSRMTGMLENIGSIMGNLSGVVGEGTAAWFSYGSTILNAIAQALPAIAAVIGGNIAQAFAGAAAQSQTVPFPYNLISLTASMAAVGAAVASIPKFADGGIAYGPTLGIFGEYAGASNNPEVVAPLDKLRDLIGSPDAAGGGNFTVKLVANGRDMMAVIDKNMLYKQRTR